jgi:hypothetical protein
MAGCLSTVQMNESLRKVLDASSSIDLKGDLSSQHVEVFCEGSTRSLWECTRLVCLSLLVPAFSEFVEIKMRRENGSDAMILLRFSQYTHGGTFYVQCVMTVTLKVPRDPCSPVLLLSSSFPFAIAYRSFAEPCSMILTRCSFVCHVPS